MPPLQFPVLTARALSGHEFELPADLPADRTVVIAAFRQWHQRLVDDWIGALVDQGVPGTPRGSETLATGLIELPVLKRRWGPARAFIDGGMAAGIADDDVNARTWTTYTDVAGFLRALGESGEQTVLVAVADRSGAVSTVVRGPVNEASLETVMAAIA